MTFVPYVNDIPFATHTPAQDQPDMLANTNAIDTILKVDHFSFNNSSGGLHRQVTLPSLGAVPTNPFNLAVGRGSVFTNTVTRTLTESPFTSTNSVELFYNGGDTNQLLQLTQQITADFATFGTNTNYIAPVTTFGGWTFLSGGTSGGMILQYGFIVPTATPGGTTVNFPVQFKLIPFSIQVTALNFNPTTTSDLSASIRSTNIDTKKFVALTTSTGTVVGFYWMAIGV